MTAIIGFAEVFVAIKAPIFPEPADAANPMFVFEFVQEKVVPGSVPTNAVAGTDEVVQ